MREVDNSELAPHDKKKQENYYGCESTGNRNSAQI